MCESSLKPQISNKILCGQRGIQAVLPCRTVHDTKLITAFTEIYAIIQFNHYTTLQGRKSKACNPETNAGLLPYFRPYNYIALYLPGSTRR